MNLVSHIRWLHNLKKLLFSAVVETIDNEIKYLETLAPESRLSNKLARRYNLFIIRIIIYLNIWWYMYVICMNDTEAISF